MTNRIGLLRIGLLVALVALVSACNWATLGYGPERTHHNPIETKVGVANVGSLIPKWSGPDVEGSGGTHRPSAAIANGIAYVATDTALRAFSAGGFANCSGTPRSCEPLWTASVGVFPPVSTATVANGVVYVGSGDGDLYAFDAAGSTNCSGTPKTCQPLWTGSVDSHGLTVSTPAVANGVVYVSSSVATLVAFDARGMAGCSGVPKRCTPLWTGSGGDTAYSMPTVAGGVVYVNGGNELLAFDAGGVTNCSGSPNACVALWTAPLRGGNPAPPAVANGFVYDVDHDRLSVFDALGTTGCAGVPKTCDPVWTVTIGRTAMTNSPAIANGVAYFGTSDGWLYAFDATGATDCSDTPESCEPLWSAQLGTAGVSSPAVANGLVYVSTDGTANGNLYAFDAAGSAGCVGAPGECEPLFSAPILPTANDASPTVANGFVYVQSTGALHAFGL